MKITYLGHAGFCVETDQTILIMDPWLSQDGAFDASWFQFPCNHHLQSYVLEKLMIPHKQRYIYISHEHKDHFDLKFLSSINHNDFSFIIPKFRRSELREALCDISAKAHILCEDKQALSLPDMEVTLFLDDSELNRDSAICVQSKDTVFFNMNDCKLHDELVQIKSKFKSIDVFACQYSGATWHPTCYEYPQEEYESISHKKMMSKFQATARAIETLEPNIFIPSAGPPCFLDPELFHLNFQKINIFPRNGKLIKFLQGRLKHLMNKTGLEFPDVMPGDILDAETKHFIHLEKERFNEEHFEQYLNTYANRYALFFETRKERFANVSSSETLLSLKESLSLKLQEFSLRDEISVPLYFSLKDYDDECVRVDFQNNVVEITSQVQEESYYSISAPSWEIERVLHQLITWEDFSLTFRATLNREPDIYQTLMQGFLILETEDLEFFTKKYQELQNNKEKIEVEAGGCRYLVDRFCPHQGADLSQGWIEEDRYLVCPRHRWRFDLENDGKCDTNNDCIHAMALVLEEN